MKKNTNLYEIAIILYLAIDCAAASEYSCQFGPDAYGQYITEIVDTTVANTCGDFCECVGLTNNLCYFGPDDQGNFLAETVSSEIADACDSTFCICDSHKFEDETVTFEKALDERQKQAIDRTLKPHEEKSEESGDVSVVITEPYEEVEIEWETPSFKKAPLVASAHAFVLILVSVVLLFSLLFTIVFCFVKQRRAKERPLSVV